MLISIVIPVYNRANIISKTLDSILAQTYHDWECIVVDDYSTDATRDVVLKYCNSDNRFKLLSNKRKKGAQGARNTGILSALAEWICIFDSDDYMYIDYLEKLTNEINDDRDVISCWANKLSITTGISEPLKWGGNGNIEQGLLSGKVYVGYDSSIIKKEKLIMIGLLDEEIKAYQELDTHIRLSAICNYHAIEEILFDYIVDVNDSISTKVKNVQSEKYFNVINKHRRVWRKKAYKDYIRLLTQLFWGVNFFTKFTLLRIAPEVLFTFPIFAINVIKNKSTSPK